jgi:FkbM family methyltransferase
MKKQIRQIVENNRDSGIPWKILGILFDFARDSYVHRYLSPRYKSEHAQDGYVDNYFNGMRHGFYVEVGAHVGFTKSNTFFFHFARGWSGVCIEPNPQLYPQLVANRASKTCICFPYAIDSYSGESSFIPADFWGRLEERIDERDIADFYQDTGQKRVVVPVRTLQQVLDTIHPNITHVDYLSIDTEGNDLNVLKGIDWSRMSFGIIEAENKHEDNNIRDYLTERGYMFDRRLGIDDMFISLKS